MGIRNPYNIQIIRDIVSVPVIVDAGVGTASDAANRYGTRLRWRPPQHRGRQSTSAGPDGNRHAKGGRGG